MQPYWIKGNTTALSAPCTVSLTQIRRSKSAGTNLPRFGCIEDSRSFAQGFFSWYNTEHHHSGIGLLTPEAVHYGLAEKTQKARGEILSAAYEAHPERFVRKRPVPPSVPAAVWINKPKVEPVSEGTVH